MLIILLVVIFASFGWIFSRLAVQPGLGLLSQRRLGLGGGHSGDSAVDGKNIVRAVALIRWREALPTRRWIRLCRKEIQRGRRSTPIRKSVKRKSASEESSEKSNSGSGAQETGFQSRSRFVRRQHGVRRPGSGYRRVGRRSQRHRHLLPGRRAVWIRHAVADAFFLSVHVRDTGNQRARRPGYRRGNFRQHSQGLSAAGRLLASWRCSWFPAFSTSAPILVPWANARTCSREAQPGYTC